MSCPLSGGLLLNFFSFSCLMFYCLFFFLGLYCTYRPCHQPSTERRSINIYSQILQEIYNIQDRLEKLSSEINSNDSSVISILADKLAISNTKSPEVALTEILLSKLIDEPEKFAAVSKKFGKSTPKKE